MTTEPALTPNHHAHHPHFAGLPGLLAAVSMLGRGSDARLVIELSGLRSGERVVDVGCGPGSAARHAAGLGATVTGVDPARVMLRVARLLSRPARIRYVEAAAERLPLSDGCAEVVWTIASVHHWSDVDAALAEVRRVLVPGGRFVAVERLAQPGASGLASHGWTESQAQAFASACTRQGLTRLTVDRQTRGRRTTVSVVGSSSG